MSGERVLWEEQMGFFGKDKYIKKPEMRRFVIMFVSTGVSGLSSFFRLENSERVNFFLNVNVSVFNWRIIAL